MSSELYYTLKKTQRICRLTTLKDEIIIRCPFCGDSVKNLNDAHLYISNKSPHKYFCQKCNTAGLVNEKFLNILEINDVNLIMNINKEYSQYLKQANFKFGANFNLSNINLKYKQDLYYDNDFRKLDYVEKRLGIKIDEDDLEKYKMVLNLETFLLNNNIDINKRLNNSKGMEQQFKTLVEDTVGFVSYDKNLIVCRSLDAEKTGFRYYNFRINPFDADNSIKYYAIKNDLDLSKPVVDIVISEGIMDIISIYNNIYNKDDNNKLFLSNNGKSYSLVFNHLMQSGILNANIDIYSDSDVNLKFYNKLKRYNDFANLNGFNVHYNKIGKDYGVTKDKILLEKPFIF